MAVNKFAISAHVAEIIDTLNKMPAFSGTAEQNETLGEIYRNNGQVASTLLGFEYGKMVAKREERARRNKRQESALSVGKSDLHRLSQSLENILTAQGPFLFEITDADGTRRREVEREFFLEHSVDILLQEVYGLIEKMEESK